MACAPRARRARRDDVRVDLRREDGGRGRAPDPRARPAPLPARGRFCGSTSRWTARSPITRPSGRTRPPSRRGGEARGSISARAIRRCGAPRASTMSCSRSRPSGRRTRRGSARKSACSTRSGRRGCPPGITIPSPRRPRSRPSRSSCCSTGCCCRWTSSTPIATRARSGRSRRAARRSSLCADLPGGDRDRGAGARARRAERGARGGLRDLVRGALPLRRLRVPRRLQGGEAGGAAGGVPGLLERRAVAPSTHALRAQTSPPNPPLPSRPLLVPRRGRRRARGARTSFFSLFRLPPRPQDECPRHEGSG